MDDIVISRGDLFLPYVHKPIFKRMLVLKTFSPFSVCLVENTITGQWQIMDVMNYILSTYYKRMNEQL